jgi:tRNA threonylcarbamoyladenosine biosynthesis protein TsaB
VNLLIVDTSSNATVLGLARGDEILDRTSGDVKTHSREILPSIESLLHEAGVTPGELEAVIYGRGPGSFTGLRIAVGVVQGLAYGLQIPAVPVSSMAAMAQAVVTANSLEEAHVFVGLFARLQEVYYGAYHLRAGAFPGEITPEGVLDVSELPALESRSKAPWLAVGNASELWTGIESSTGVKFASVTENAIPSVTSLLVLGRQVLESGGGQDARQASPVYLREEVAEKPVSGRQK